MIWLEDTRSRFLQIISENVAVNLLKERDRIRRMWAREALEEKEGHYKQGWYFSTIHMELRPSMLVYLDEVTDKKFYLTDDQALAYEVWLVQQKDSAIRGESFGRKKPKA
jgi:hypothetical protein